MTMMRISTKATVRSVSSHDKNIFPIIAAHDNGHNAIKGYSRTCISHFRINISFSALLSTTMTRMSTKGTVRSIFFDDM